MGEIGNLINLFTIQRLVAGLHLSKDQIRLFTAVRFHYTGSQPIKTIKCKITSVKVHVFEFMLSQRFFTTFGREDNAPAFNAQAILQLLCATSILLLLVLMQSSLMTCSPSLILRIHPVLFSSSQGG